MQIFLFIIVSLFLTSLGVYFVYSGIKDNYPTRFPNKYWAIVYGIFIITISLVLTTLVIFKS